ncbi:hypothetical protein KDX16_02130 [Burkholderia vietnamiensis]|uniref:hypothetical protein n=1 Tax=Burkholderia vietnamiensis TaxID=60552 RepID=UPI0012D8E0C3|nr:hypothetical protein [Burkholderia vietnamiensis]MBR7914641.1 hypothetical protein [Burkholderia vietnamiensis]
MGARKNQKYMCFRIQTVLLHLLWKALQPYENAGLQVRLIPIGFLRNDSTGKAAALLDSKEKSHAASHFGFFQLAEVNIATTRSE